MRNNRQMKTGTTYIYIFFSILMLMACRNQASFDKLSDSEKLEVLDRRIEKNHGEASLLAQRAQILLNLGRTEEAISDIEAAVKSEPENVAYNILMADIYFASGNINGSYKALSDAERIEPDNNEVQLKLGEVAFYSRNYDRAMKCLTKVTEHEPNNRTALFMKGFIYKETGDTANSIVLFRKVCDQFPEYAPAFEELGILYSQLGNTLAADYLATAIKIDPANTNAMYALGMYHQEHGEFEEAEGWYNKMLEINANSSDAWHNLGYIELFHYRDYEKAIEYLTKAIEASTDAIEAITNRGCAYELAGNNNLALADFEAAAAIDPDFTPAIEGIKRVKR